MLDIEKLRNAELLFKFSLLISATCATAKESPFSYLKQFAFLGHSVSEDELLLSLAQERWGAVIVEHVATNLLAVQIDTALEHKFGRERFDHADADISWACCLARLIRNAFAHDPFGPVWEIRPKNTAQTYTIDGILSLDTSELHRQAVKREHYGGPLALLRFLQFTINLISK